jgi:hypothetical protein
LISIPPADVITSLAGAAFERLIVSGKQMHFVFTQEVLNAFDWNDHL